MHTTMARSAVRRPGRVRIGPQDNRRRMALKDLVRAETAPGFLYELAGGVIEVTEIPGK